jgi:hypothetical protein
MQRQVILSDFIKSYDGFDSNYIANLNDSVFCLVPRGFAGWTYRMVDVIFAGFIIITLSSI